MPSPRPPSEDSDGRLRVRTSRPAAVAHRDLDRPGIHDPATCSHRPCSGRACNIELLSSSLSTRAASPIAVSNTPAAAKSAVMRRRATATLAGADGRSTTLDSLTSLSTAPMPIRAEKLACERRNAQPGCCGKLQSAPSVSAV